MGCFSPDAPAQRDYATETATTLANQIALAPAQYWAESTYQPLYTQLGLQNAQTAMFGNANQQGLLDLYAAAQPRLNAMSAQANTAQRTADVADVTKLAPQAIAAMRGATPPQTALMDLLNQQATQGLQAGSQILPGDAYRISQGVRSDWANRGLGASAPAQLSEAMGLYGAGESARQGRQQFGSQVAGINQAVYGDPYLQILGRPSQSFSAAQGYGQQAQGLVNGSGASLFNPESSYAGNIYNSNQQYSALFAQPSTLSKYNMLFDSVIGKPAGAFGSMAGGLGAACWVAREVYGADDPRWMLFRTWLHEEAPEWFFNLYVRHGEAFAAWIHDKPRLKALIRVWMNGRIRRYMKGAPYAKPVSE